VQLFEDFVCDTNPISVYMKILDTIESAENFLLNHFKNTLASGSSEIRRVCKHMLQISKRFVEGLYRYMDSTYWELNVSFGDKKEMYKLVCFCIYELFNTKFKSSREVTEGILFLKSKES